MERQSDLQIFTCKYVKIKHILNLKWVQIPLRGTQNPPSPQFRWQEIIWTATAAQINFLDQPLSGGMTYG